MLSARAALAAVACTGTVAGAAYLLFALERMRRFRAQHAKSEAFTPPITVFKPLHGAEPALYENLRSFCDQAYPSFQVIFGSADPADPALDVARRLQREFPSNDITVVAGSAADTRNPKVGNLIGMRPHARHGVWLIADSDMRVGPEYLSAIGTSFGDESNGAVTCVYGGVPLPDFAARLGAMYVNDQFAPSVLVAAAIEPLTYCFGATMAVRRDVLDAVGGLERLGDALGDDYELGRAVRQAGREIALCPYVVQTTVSDTDLRALWLHELRWARTILAQRPAGYAGSIVTYALPFAATWAALAPSWISAIGFAGVAAIRTLVHYRARETFAPQTPASPWLIPLRDALGVAVWTAAFFGRTVRWRGARFFVEAGGHMAAEE